MVEQEIQLDAVFGSLSDPTRRDILRRVGRKSMGVSEIATHYELTFAAVAKHVDVLHRARLVSKERRGKEQIVSLSPAGLTAAGKYLEAFEELWEKRLDSLGEFLQGASKKKKH